MTTSEPLKQDNSIQQIIHNGVEYQVDLDDDTQAEVQLVRDYIESPYMVWWVYWLTNCHQGPPIEIEVSNPQMERDDDGWGLEYDQIRWADDKSPFNDDILTDCYWDAVRDDIKETLMNQ